MKDETKGSDVKYRTVKEVMDLYFTAQADKSYEVPQTNQLWSFLGIFKDAGLDSDKIIANNSSHSLEFRIDFVTLTRISDDVLVQLFKYNWIYDIAVKDEWDSPIDFFKEEETQRYYRERGASEVHTITFDLTLDWPSGYEEENLDFS